MLHENDINVSLRVPTVARRSLGFVDKGWQTDDAADVAELYVSRLPGEHRFRQGPDLYLTGREHLVDSAAAAASVSIHHDMDAGILAHRLASLLKDRRDLLLGEIADLLAGAPPSLHQDHEHITQTIEKLKNVTTSVNVLCACAVGLSVVGVHPEGFGVGRVVHRTWAILDAAIARPSDQYPAPEHVRLSLRTDEPGLVSWMNAWGNVAAVRRVDITSWFPRAVKVHSFPDTRLADLSADHEQLDDDDQLIVLRLLSPSGVCYVECYTIDNLNGHLLVDSFTATKNEHPVLKTYFQLTLKSQLDKGGDLTLVYIGVSVNSWQRRHRDRLQIAKQVTDPKSITAKMDMLMYLLFANRDVPIGVQRFEAWAVQHAPSENRTGMDSGFDVCLMMERALSVTFPLHMLLNSVSGGGWLFDTNTPIESSPKHRIQRHAGIQAFQNNPGV